MLSVVVEKVKMTEELSSLLLVACCLLIELDCLVVDNLMG